MTETLLMRSIMHALTKDRLCMLERNNVGKLRDKRGQYVKFGLGEGSPDLVGIYQGRFIGIEVKTPKGRLSDVQRRWHAIATQHGARIVTARSIEEALECLK
jgi:hypothetical protein